jgi:aminoglycoside/choline kinase family phosphotransferase
VTEPGSPPAAPEPEHPLPWWEAPDWLEAATAWIRERAARRGLAPAGEVQVVKNWSISCLLRVPVASGNLYFKAVPPLFAAEGRITETVAALFPEHAPAVIGVEAERGWLLLDDLGPVTLRDAPLAAWDEALRVWARLQIACLDRVELLLAAGLPDHRPSQLATEIDALLDDSITQRAVPASQLARLRAQAPRLRALCAEVADSFPSASLIHGDLHPGNVAVRDGRPIFFDWTDGAVGHPFCDLATFLPDVDELTKQGIADAPERLRNAYLSVWADQTGRDPGQLAQTFESAYTVGSLVQALSYRRILHGTPAQAHYDWPEALAYFLGRVLEGLEDNDGTPPSYEQL